ncbi:MAG: hypothetical protein IKB75_06890 [Clostridia bacterium]|nr:hypothetical protein [Clostridia bacterium]
MELKALAARLGIPEYPQALEEIYRTLPADDGLLCNHAFITEMQEKYDAVGEFLDDVLRGADALRADADRYLWARLMCQVIKGSRNRVEALRIPLPPNNETLAADMLPILILVYFVPAQVERYRARGMSDEQIRKNVNNIRVNIWVASVTQGRPMLTPGLFGWLHLYMYGLIFDHASFNFQPDIWSSSVVLRNKKTGEYVHAMPGGIQCHRSGYILGSAGCEDEEDSFTTSYIEQVDFIEANLSTEGLAQRERTMLYKDEWEVVLRPGDDVISLHIPRNTDITPEVVTQSLREGMELCRKYYPELSFRYIICISWLVDPQLVEILGENAKMAQFSKRFVKCPYKCAGNGCLGYVFPGFKGDVADYPENTSLQRGIKALMLGGGFIHNVTGVIPELF